MTHSHHQRTPALLGRTDSTRPPRTHHSRATATPIPATVWTCGPTPIDPNAVWPTPIVKKIITSFSKPGGHVLLLPWPTTTPTATHAVIDTGAPEADTELATALTAITDLDRTVHVAHFEPTPPTSRPAPQPFWTDRAHTLDHASAPQPDTPQRVDLTARDVDVIITSLRPEHSMTLTSDHLRDHITQLATHLLRPRGILTVLTHSDWSHGELIDPTGPVVASAQHADLLYLQHIIALHTPWRGNRFLWHPTPTDPTATNTPGTPVQFREATHRAQGHRRVHPHHRISSDILVFTQPRDHQPPSPTAVFATAAT
jgi:hypothetical protein